jgi:3,4-dihydroxy 2-butanone 4-phosphate synthase
MLDIENIALTLREGKPILVFDETDREGETDIFFSAKYSTNSSIRFLRENGGGMIFLAAENSASTKLGLPFAHEIYETVSTSNKNFSILDRMLNHSIPYDKKSSFSIFINHKDTFTGISDHDRALTSKSFASVFEESVNLSHSESQKLVSDNFRIPGHVPVCIADSNLLNARQGHTELIVSLLKMADMNPVAVGCEMIGSDGHSLSSGKAKSWALSKGYLFLEGRQIIERYQ